MSRLLNRRITITFTAPGERSLIVRDMHVKFSITKTLEKNPNTMSMNIDNLSPLTRGYLSKKDVTVLVDVGYEDAPQQRIFVGDITWTFSSKVPSGWDTLIQAGDGANKYRRARLARSYRKGTTAYRAMKELAEAMGLKVPKNARAALQNHEFLAGMTVSGPASEEIGKLLNRVGLSWSIQDGEIQILAPTEVRASEAVLIAQSTGMIGSPQLSPPNGKKKNSVMTAKTLLEPRIIPGGLVAVRSLAVTGDYKVLRAQHDADSKSGDYATSIEAESLR